MNKTLHIVALCSLTAAVGAQAEVNTTVSTQAKNTKTGYVDTFKVMQNCESGRQAADKVKAKQESMTKELQDDQQAIAKVMQDAQQRIAKAMTDLQSKGAALKPEKREEEEKRIADMRRNEEKKIADARRNLETKAQEFEEELKVTMQKITEQVEKEVIAGAAATAQAQGLDTVICGVTGRVLWSRPELDVTDAVIKQVDNKSHKAPASATKVTQSSVPAKAKAA